jgi:hypothetical protein
LSCASGAGLLLLLLLNMLQKLLLVLLPARQDRQDDLDEDMPDAHALHSRTALFSRRQCR